MGMLSSILKERRVLTNVRLTDHQKEVLVRIFSAPNESIAADDAFRGGQPYVEAVHTLQRLGFIDVDSEERTARITETGEQVMKDAYLLDEVGQLTPDAQEFIEQPDEFTSPPTAPGPEQGGEGGGDLGDLGLESFSLIKSLSK